MKRKRAFQAKRYRSIDPVEIKNGKSLKKKKVHNRLVQVAKSSYINVNKISQQFKISDDVRYCRNPQSSLTYF